MEDEISTEVIEKADIQIGAGIWGDKSTVSADKPVVEDKKIDDIIVDKPIEIPVEWLKKEFEIEDPAILKAEREELKSLKANPPKADEIKFADEQSKQIHELLREGKPENKKAIREYLQVQEQLDELTSITEVNKDNAEDIIKLQLKLTNKTLSPKEVDFEYKQFYTATKEPVQKASEDEDDFKERHDEWKEQVSIIEMRRIVAAKKAQPELAKLKTEIVLPEIQQPKQATKQPTQEELETAKRAVTGFIESVETDLKTLNETSIMVKDEEVQIPISYVYSPEEKAKVSQQLKDFASDNFNANVIFAERWLTEDGTLNVSRMTRDLARLNSGDKIEQKIGNDAAAKRLKEYTRDKKNIHIDGGGSNQNGNFDPVKAIEEVEAAIWK